MAEKLFPSVRSRAPLRLGLAGGGTDLSPYCDTYGGAVLNVTIGRYAYAAIEMRTDGLLHFVANDLGKQEMLSADENFAIDEGLRLHRTVYKHIIETFNNNTPLPMTLTTWIECPMGSGLGASSALTVALIGAFRQLLGIKFAPEQIAALAYELERVKLRLSGGRQDQFTAAYGGLNFMEFCADDRVIVNPLHLDSAVLCELQASLLLCFTGTSRESATIIDKQVESIQKSQGRAVDALHKLKRDALEMKLALLDGKISRMIKIFRESWEAKKRTAAEVSNLSIDHIYADALKAGARAGKISGAGGGGFMMLLVDPLKKNDLAVRLAAHGYEVSNCNFTTSGLETWNCPAGFEGI